MAIGSEKAAIRIVDQDDRPHDYIPRSFSERDGTIYEYFDTNLVEEKSQKLIETAPDPVSGF